jgi:hypothetical protein
LLPLGGNATTTEREIKDIRPYKGSWESGWWKNIPAGMVEKTKQQKKM